MAHAPAPLAANPRPGGVLAALLDFERAPGRYPVARREPALLFDGVGTVLRLATDRAVDGLDSGGSVSALRARQAARFFVRNVMLRPGADHYTLLGLTPDSAPELQRAHYRMMIRLAHPDFASADETWPADAASRINFANDVLSSPVQRLRYNATLAPEPTPSAPLKAIPAPQGTPREWGGEGRLSRLLSRLLTRRGTHATVTVLLLAGVGWLFIDTEHPGASLTVKRAAAPTAALSPAEIHTPQGMRLLLDTATHSTAQDTAPTTIRLEDVQPTMDQVLGALRSGRGETVLQVLNQEWRSHPSTTRFVGDFNQRLAGRTVRGLDEVKSSGSSAAGLFVVDSAIDFRLQNALQQDETLRLNLKAVFLAHDGAPVLTRLVAQP
ncbi:MAG: J domain-containing protein [Hydrogenophaga sp.]|uniref:J domain-containing protein n=1 Tax=Hydrogenophaga sp. TaxID=1904254 RepID=UPI0025BFE3EE|nr:J domain-containing protein [Hydrogenophaga sp.]MBT9550782.1 J domain-containing protein [Hydrogenophaga sp.]